ncbi:MAG TPA: hypothetical protein VGC07_06115 [Granulicella sp.]
MSDHTPETQLPDFDTMTAAEFEHFLPDLFASAPNGIVSTDPRLQTFLAANPDCAALVRDLEAIATAARNLFEPTVEEEPEDDDIWQNIQKKLATETAEPGLEPETE